MVGISGIISTEEEMFVQRGFFCPLANTPTQTCLPDYLHFNPRSINITQNWAYTSLYQYNG